MLQVVGVIVLVPVLLVTVVNVYGAVAVRAPLGARRTDVRAAIWCAIAALAGFVLVVMALSQQ